MISVVICRRPELDTWDIDTWLMSCRVLGRGVETMVLRELLAHARKAGIRRLQGSYHPTERNKLVANHYSALGFSLIAQNDGVTQWEMQVEAADPRPAPMEVRSSGFAQQRESVPS